MIIEDLDVPGRSVVPFETNSPLIVDPNAVLSASIPVQGFNPIARRNAKIVHATCRIHSEKLRPGALLNPSWQRFDE
jgi:hypothetical protein